MGGSNELVECFCGGAVAEGYSGAVARLVGDGVLAVSGRGSSVVIGTPARKSFPRSASQFLYTVPDLPGARTPSRCAPVMSPSGRWFRGISIGVCAIGYAPDPRPRARRSPPPPHARDLERLPHNPGTQPAGCTTQHRAPEPVGCETHSSDGSPPSQRADHTDHNDQATQSSSR